MVQDAECNYRYGMECLFRFFSYGLEIKFRLNLFEEWQHMVLSEFDAGHSYGLEKLWAFLHYRKSKTELPLEPRSVTHYRLEC